MYLSALEGHSYQLICLHFTKRYWLQEVEWHMNIILYQTMYDTDPLSQNYDTVCNQTWFRPDKIQSAMDCTVILDHVVDNTYRYHICISLLSVYESWTLPQIYTAKNRQPESSIYDIMCDIVSVSDMLGTESGMIQTCYIVIVGSDLSENHDFQTWFLMLLQMHDIHTCIMSISWSDLIILGCVWYRFNI